MVLTKGLGSLNQILSTVLHSLNNFICHILKYLNSYPFFTFSLFFLKFFILLFQVIFFPLCFSFLSVFFLLISSTLFCYLRLRLFSFDFSLESLMRYLPSIISSIFEFSSLKQTDKIFLSPQL